MCLKTNVSTLKWPGGQRAGWETIQALLSLVSAKYPAVLLPVKGSGAVGGDEGPRKPGRRWEFYACRTRQGGQCPPLLPHLPSTPHPRCSLFGPRARNRHRGLARGSPGEPKLEQVDRRLNCPCWVPSSPSPASLCGERLSIR